MSFSPNVNVKTSYGRNVNNINVKVARAERARRIAQDLVHRFGTESEGSYRFFLKAAWRLSENEIYDAYEYAHRDGIGSPLKYFIATLKSQVKMS